MGRSPWMRKQEPDKYPLHCRTLLMTQELVASAAASTLQQPQPPTGCDALRTVPAFSSMPFKSFPQHRPLSLSRAGRATEVFAGLSRQRSVFLPHLGEGFHAAVDVLIAVHSRDLDADAGLSLGDHGVAEANDINTWKGNSGSSLGGRLRWYWVTEELLDPTSPLNKHFQASWFSSGICSQAWK